MGTRAIGQILVDDSKCVVARLAGNSAVVDRRSGTGIVATRLCLQFPSMQERAMARCEVCGNDYDKAFSVTQGSHTMTFDSFECAIHAMAPKCGHCQCSIVGHGVEAKGKIYCCAHCAKHEGATGISDRAA
jgi:hypothetical protein